VAHDHRERPVVAVHDIHRHRRHVPDLGAGDQGADQRRSQAPVLPGIGHHHADIGRPGPARPGNVHRQAVPDDGAVAGGEQGVGAALGAAQEAEQGRADVDGGEEPQVSGLDRQFREEVAQRGQIRWTRRADRGDETPDLSSAHGPRMLRSC
jgi:hypothetical protein